MIRSLFILCLSLMWIVPAGAQPHKVRKEAPPSHGKHKHGKHKHKHGKHKGPHKVRREAPPAPGKAMPVREQAVFSRFTPLAGPPGVDVVIYGQHFDPTTTVRFNGRRLPIHGRSSTELRIRIPRKGVSDRFVVSKAGFSDVSHDATFHVIRPARLKRFHPKSGPRDTVIKVRGKNFLPSDQFLIGDVELTAIRLRPRRAKLRIPARAITGLIRIKREGQVVAVSKRPFLVTGLPPLINSFAPNRGGRGTIVRLTGQNFEPRDFITLNGKRLPTRRRAGDFIEVVIGNHRSGHFVLRGAGGRHFRAHHPFTMILPLKVGRFFPNFGPAGTQITIRGTGFLKSDQAFIGGAMLSVRNITEDTILVALPAGVQSGRIGVQRGGKRVHARGRFEVVRAPAISNVSPVSGPPGVKVNILGRDFVPGVTVHLAGKQLRILNKRLPDSLTVVIPPGARSGRLVVVTKGGSAQSNINFKVINFATLSSFFPLHGLPGSRVTLRGSFHPGIQVFLARRPVPLVQQTDTTAVVEIPAGAKSGRFMVQSFGRRVKHPQLFKVDVPVPEITFTLSPTTVVRGNEVTLTVTPAGKSPLTVYFNGRPLPKKTLHGGRTLVVIVPSDARNGYFEIEYQGRRYRSRQRLRVR